jgi:gamma-glutamylcyclotransferase (GGCT)/AIG2-like uncharacterized protein YtfP
MQEQFISDDAPQVVPLFVYGTLRPGGALYDRWIGPAVVDSERATVAGHRLVTWRGGSFPLMVEGAAALTTGTLLWCDRRHPAFVRTLRMEMNAGYTLSMVQSEVESVTGDLPALSFTWDRPVFDAVPVPFNDWFATSHMEAQ